jgi:drug/metabolite transporter (DMT)-like permease
MGVQARSRISQPSGASQETADRREERLGLVWGLLGVFSFSLTLPATKAALTALSPLTVGLGRALVAAVLAGLVLLLKRGRVPTWRQTRQLVIVAAGVVGGFPFLTAWAMERVPASHGAIVLALLPLATAGAAAFFAGERPSRRYWISSAAACLAILAYAAGTGLGGLQQADLALLGAVLAAAVGYAVGGQLARTMGGWQVISWALVFSFPLLVVPMAGPLVSELRNASWSAWLGFGYVSVVSQYLGFFAWYHGLAVGGVARVGQTQYLQPFFTLAASALLLGESITPGAVAAAVIVVAAVAQGRRAAVIRIERS